LTATAGRMVCFNRSPWRALLRVSEVSFPYCFQSFALANVPFDIESVK
jgi:hypothetical protein